MLVLLACLRLVGRVPMLPWIFLVASFFLLPASSRCQLLLVASFFSLPASSVVAMLLLVASFFLLYILPGVTYIDDSLPASHPMFSHSQ
jgi:hypothetical protein